MPSMIHAPYGLRRLLTPARRLAVGIAVFLSSAAIGLSADWDREGARRAWEDAERLRAGLSQTSPVSRDGYQKCIRTYQIVYLKDPHFVYSDDAVFEAARLSQELGENSGDADAFRNAARLYQFLATDYPQSPFCPEALLRLGMISEGPLADQAAARSAYERLRSRFPSSQAAARLASRTVAAPAAGPPGNVPEAARTQALGDAAAGASHMPVLVKNLLFATGKEFTRINIVSDGEVRYTRKRLSGPDRVFFDIANARLEKNLVNKAVSVGDRFVRQVRLGQYSSDIVRVVLDLESAANFEVTDLGEAFGITVSVQERGVNPSRALPPRQLAVEVPAASVGITSAAARVAPAASPPAPLRVEESKSEAAPLNPAPKGSPDAGASGRDNPGKELRPGGEKAPGSPKTDGEAQPDGSNVPRETAARDAGMNVPPPHLEPSVPSLPPKAASPTRSGDRTMTRMLGLKIGRIVLDPGHGGHDTGTVGPGGLMEKNLVLQVAKELRTLLEDKLGAEVVLTREDDRFISLEERTAIANQNKADLFLSIHANSASSRNISGVETYFLDFARTDDAREVAARENAATGHNVRDLQSLIRRIAQADKVEESKELAAIIQKNLFSGMRKIAPSSQNRGVRSAPFIVLIGANMPSVLAEVAFLSNPRDEKLLKKDVSRRSLAGALFQGIQGYMKTLGTEMAQNRNHSN